MRLSILALDRINLAARAIALKGDLDDTFWIHA